VDYIEISFSVYCNASLNSGVSSRTNWVSALPFDCAIIGVHSLQFLLLLPEMVKNDLQRNSMADHKTLDPTGSIHLLG
jgi:hypothetical protein